MSVSEAGGIVYFFLSNWLNPVQIINMNASDLMRRFSMYNYSNLFLWNGFRKKKLAVPESTPIFIQYFVSREESQS